MYASTQFFFVPYRLLWTNFEKFHGAQEDPGDSIAFTIPILSGASAGAIGDVSDYLGIPVGTIPDNTGISALPFRALYLIWNNWYRDENLQNSQTFPVDDGPDSNGEVGWANAPLKRGKRFDYYTSCLPSPQKGTAVSLPLAGTAQVYTTAADNETLGVWNAVGAASTLHRTMEVIAGPPGDVTLDTGTLADAGLLVDLTTATATTINDFRLAIQTQRLLERDARSGTRYVETLKARWGVTSPDFRLQRAEFLGGGESKINVVPTPQTSGQGTPIIDDHLGQLGGFGTVSGTHSFSKSFVEHGVLIGLCSVRADQTYSQGLDRYWSKSTRYDFMYPELTGIGEQSVLNKELWVTFADTGTVNDAVFGYQERYAEYRFQNSKLSGLMRPDASGTLAAWHLSIDESSLPTLGNTFITQNLTVPLDRAIAITTEPHFKADFFFDIKAARPMPTYGIPGSLGRF